MSACYVLGSTSGIGKKSGKWFGMSVLLFKDQYGQWMTEKAWWESEEAFKASDYEICEVGSPVRILRDESGRKLAVMNLREDIPALELPFD